MPQREKRRRKVTREKREKGGGVPTVSVFALVPTRWGRDGEKSYKLDARICKKGGEVCGFWPQVLTKGTGVLSW